MQKTLSRQKIRVTGLVQGVGFRPFVYNLAKGFELTGFVLNQGAKVEIEVQGDSDNLENFAKALSMNAPARSEIKEMTVATCVLKPEETEFVILESREFKTGTTYIPLDSATCNDCLKELFDPHDRRYLYPFINCINCGPRFTIIEKLPYDRLSTTMRSFDMCAQCCEEYNDPTNRRFHAQPNACQKCGPTLTFNRNGSQLLAGQQALNAAQEALLDNQVIAVKGLGGYHLMGNAKSDFVVDKIRFLKKRKDKPLAVMFHSIDEIAAYCCLDSSEKDILAGPVGPIVLLKRREESAQTLAQGINQGLGEIGALLAYTPLHHLLLSAISFPLIATSANDDGLPIVTNDQQAASEFTDIGVLAHDRAILSGYDDSIVRIQSEKISTIRRGRGLAPGHILLPFRSDKSVIAFGAHLKNTFCVTDGQTATLSQHMGDIQTIERLQTLEKTIDLYLNLFGIEPQLLVSDLHPDYETTKIAECMSSKLQLPLLKVQHHHAHAVSVMAEHGLDRAIAVIFDGMGLGDDGNIWGGEFLLCTYKSFERLAHLEYVPMPGGESAVRHPWRMSLGFIQAMNNGGRQFQKYFSQLEGLYKRETISSVVLQIEKKLNSPLTSSVGRLFDAAAAIINPQICPSYEGQAAMELEALAWRCKCLTHEPFSISLGEEDGKSIIYSTRILESLQEALESGLPKQCAAHVFHRTLSTAVLKMLTALELKTGVKDICISGGVFQNTLLSKLVIEGLGQAGFRVFTGGQLPVNDAGLSYGQAVVGLAIAS